MENSGVCNGSLFDWLCLLGLMIGVSLSLGVWPTMLLATFLAFVVGISLAGHSLMKREGIQFSKGVRIVLLGEIVSITVMEIAMNGVDYWVGGVQAMSLSEPVFWIGLFAAIPAGYIAALPINDWLISRNLKKCH